jgi:type II secretory pathway pseudopilin PulG
MNKKAFSYIEIIIVISVLAIFSGMALLFGQASQVRADVNAEAGNLASYLRLAQSRAMSGEGNSDHGIHLQGDSYIVFEGSVYTASDLNNYKIKLPNTIEIRNINLNTSSSDVIFTQPKGETLNYGTFELYSSQIDKKIPFKITSIGSIDY